MPKKPLSEPTKSGPIFVGSEPVPELLIQLLLASLDRHLTEDVDLRELGVEGELSEWITRSYRELFKPVMSAISGEGGGETQPPAAHPQASGVQVDAGVIPGWMKSVGAYLKPELLQQMIEARSGGDEEGYLSLFMKLGQRLAGPVKTLVDQLEPGPALDRALLCRRRVAKVLARCFALHKDHPLCLIGRAKRGDRQAVLDLVKIDQMFLHDSCTEKVIKEAELQSDRAFLAQLSRAQRYKLRPNKAMRYRLALYGLFTLSVELPGTTKLFLALDPEGKDFQTTAAFERFVQRCRKEYEAFMRAALKEFPFPEVSGAPETKAEQ